LENGAFAIKLQQLTYEGAKVGWLHAARNLRIKRTFELLGRQVAVESVRREKIREILAEAKVATDQGRPVDLVRLVDRIVSVISLRPSAAKRRGGAEGIEVGGIDLKRVNRIFERVAIAEVKGNPLDAAKVLRELEQVFGLKGDTTKTKE
jgi:hypothetical protein